MIFAKFDSSIYSQLSFSTTIPIFDVQNINIGRIRGNNSFSAGVIGNFGHQFVIKDGKYSISLLTELGYYRQTFSESYSYSMNYLDINIKDNLSFDTLLLGIMPKLNIDLRDLLTSIGIDSKTRMMSIGIGFGMKIPLGGKSYSYINNIEYDEKISFNDINRAFTYAVIPYIKFQIDDYFYFSEYAAFLFGVSIVYDFGIYYDVKQLDAPLSNFMNKYGLSNFEVSLNLGIKFGK